MEKFFEVIMKLLGKMPKWLSSVTKILVGVVIGILSYFLFSCASVKIDRANVNVDKGKVDVGVEGLDVEPKNSDSLGSAIFYEPDSIIGEY